MVLNVVREAEGAGGAAGGAAPRTALWLVPVADIGGVARHVLDVSRTGVPGWRIVVLCPPGELAERLRRSGRPVVAAPFGPEAGFAASVRSLRGAMRLVRPSVVHAHLGYADVVAAAVLAVDRRVRLVTTEHGIARDDLVYHGTPLRARAKAALHALRLRRADAVLAVSEATRDALVDKWRPRREVLLVRNGVDRGPQRRRARPGQAPHFLSLSRLSPEKNLPALLEAFAIVRRSRPGATLEIAGTGPQEELLRRTASRLGIAEAVALPGFTDPVEAMARADALVQLSVWENASYTLLDAAAAGLPAVATRVGGNPEILDGRRLVDLAEPGGAPEPGEVAERMLEALQEPPAPLPECWPDVAGMCARIAEVYAGLELRPQPAARPAAGRTSGGPGAPAAGETVVAANNGRIGGGEVMQLSIAAALRELGRPVRVVGPVEPGELVAAARERGLPVTAIPGRGRAGYMLGLRRWARRNRPALFWANGLVPAAATAGLPRRVVHLHWWADGANGLLARIARVGALAAFVPSRAMAERIPGTRVLANWGRPVETPPRAERADGRVRVGFLGRVSTGKGADVLARAVAELLGRGMDLELVVAGEVRFDDESAQGPVREAFAALGERCRTLGWVEPAELLGQVELLVVPSTQDEPFGLVTLEAMSAGVPVVVSDAGAIPEVVGPGYPWVFRAGDAGDAAERIAEAVRALPAEELVRRNLRRWHERYSPEAGRGRLARALAGLPAPRTAPPEGDTT
ncbi:MAG: glycosyltransferase [Pseudoclavibacter sp.]|nr:glycosyltransferase [Pseudoclavibacter sp.]